jgi:MFS family permease
MQQTERRWFPALASREFRNLWLGTLGSSAATWTLFLGVNWLAYDISGDSFAVGIVSFASLAPYLLSPITGSFADRFDRRAVIVVSRVASLVGALALAVLAFSGYAEVWHLGVLAFLTGLARSADTAGEQALLANTVAPAHILNAVTLSAAAYQGSRVIGPLAGAPLLGVVGAGGVFGMAAGFSLLSIIAVAAVRVRSTGDVARMGDVAGNTARALRYIGSTPPVLMIFGLVGIHCWLTMSYDALLPDFATNALNGGELEYNALIVAVGAGALVATLLLSTISHQRLRGSLLFAAAIGSGVTPILMAATGHVVPSAAVAVGIGATQAVFMALTTTLLQSVLPDGIRGRVMSLNFMLGAGIMSLQNLANGILADHVGTPVLFAVPGVIFAAIIVAWAVARADLRRVIRTGMLGEAPARA